MTRKVPWEKEYCGMDGKLIKPNDWVFYCNPVTRQALKKGTGVAVKVFKDTAVVRWDSRILPNFLHLSRVCKAEIEDLI